MALLSSLVPVTWADVDDLVTDFGYKPGVPVQEGVRRFVEWYVEYYKVQGGNMR